MRQKITQLDIMLQTAKQMRKPFNCEQLAAQIKTMDEKMVQDRICGNVKRGDFKVKEVDGSRNSRGNTCNLYALIQPNEEQIEQLKLL